MTIVADIYSGDYYKNPGGTLNPHSDAGGTVDCCGYLTQVIRRLGRKDDQGNYPIPHFTADELRTQGRLWGDAVGANCIPFSDLQAGDLIVWGDTSHVGIFDRMASTRIDPDNPEVTIYTAMIWLSWGTSNEDHPEYGTGHVGLHTRELAVSGKLSSDLNHWHFVRRWNENEVFNNCP